MDRKFLAAGLDKFQTVDNSRLEADYEQKYQTFMKTQPGTAEYYKKDALDPLNINLPLVDGKRTPAKCDVLTTFVHVNNQKLIDYLNKIIDDVVGVFPEGFDYYRTPQEAWHVSLVMLHDVRPADMNNPIALANVKTEEEIKKIDSIIKNIALKSFNIQLAGIRIMPHDGSVLAVFYDSGEKLVNMREDIRSAITGHGFLEDKKYPKGMVHISLLRSLQVADAETFAKLKELQEKYKNAEEPFSEEITEFYMGRETLWSHSKVDIINTYKLD